MPDPDANTDQATDASVRRNSVFRRTTDSRGELFDELVEAETIALAADGCIDTSRVLPDRFYHCGHTAAEPLGGRCGEVNCPNVSCRECFTKSRCSQCLKPLCLEHVNQAKDGERTVILCSRCLGEYKRGRFLGAILRTVLSPFVQPQDRESK